MAFHYCGNHPKPLIFANGPYACASCSQITLPAHDVVRWTHPHGNYTVAWHEDGGKLLLKVLYGRFIVLLSDDVLPYDTADFSSTTALRPPGGGSWTDNSLANRGGGFPRGSTNGNNLSGVKLVLGTHGTAPQLGLVHVLAGHAPYFHNMQNRPAYDTPFDLSSFRDNLRNLTAPRGMAVGCDSVAEQHNGNTAVHGVVGPSAHGFLVINGAGQIVTGYPSNTHSGTLNLKKKIREWR